MRPLLFLTSVATLGMLMSSCKDTGPASNMSQAEFEARVNAHLMENPEVIRDAIMKLQEKEALQELDLKKALIVAAKDALENDPRDGYVGPTDAKITIVEFFDYNCGYCKGAAPWLETIIGKYGDDLRVVFKEMPVLDDQTGTSRLAARAALAAEKQDKYKEMHFSLMGLNRLNEDIIRKTAESIGLDMDRYDADLANPSIDEHIDDTLQLSNRMPDFIGPPYFVVGDEFISGADTNRIEQLIRDGL